WHTRVGDAWDAMMENLNGWELGLIAALTVLGGYFIYKPLRIIYLTGKVLTKVGIAMFTKIWDGMKWMKGWIKGFGTGVTPTPKQLELFKAPKGGWFAKIGAGFLSIIARFKSGIALAIAEAGNILAKLASKLPGAKVISHGFVPLEGPAFKTANKAIVKGGQLASRFLGHGQGAASKGTSKALALAGRGLDIWHPGVGRPALSLAGKGWAHTALDVGDMTSHGIKPLGKQLVKHLPKAGMAGSKLAKFLKWGKLLKIPGISLLVGAGLAGMYAADGRWGRAGLELLSGALGTFPGVGTALAFALDAGLLVEDLKGTKYEGQFNKYKNAFFKDPGTAFNRQEVRAWQAKGYASAGYNEKVHGPRPSKAEFKRSLKMGREQALARA
ncbi:uncharacterized protein METZ01_LOCUS300127, partial [marine metagenome]